MDSNCWDNHCYWRRNRWKTLMEDVIVKISTEAPQIPDAIKINDKIYKIVK